MKECSVCWRNRFGAKVLSAFIVLWGEVIRPGRIIFTFCRCVFWATLFSRCASRRHYFRFSPFPRSMRFLRRYANDARPEPLIALLGAFLLTTSSWHIHFSRVGYPLVMWPLFVIISGAAVLEAMRRRTLVSWALGRHGNRRRLLYV